MATALRIMLFEVCSSNVVSTWTAFCGSEQDATVECVQRCARLTREEKVALVNKIKYGADSKKIRTEQWMITVEAIQAKHI